MQYRHQYFIDVHFYVPMDFLFLLLNPGQDGMQSSVGLLQGFSLQGKLSVGFLQFQVGRYPGGNGANLLGYRVQQGAFLFEKRTFISRRAFFQAQDADLSLTLEKPPSGSQYPALCYWVFIVPVSSLWLSHSLWV